MFDNQGNRPPDLLIHMLPTAPPLIWNSKIDAPQPCRHLKHIQITTQKVFPIHPIISYFHHRTRVNENKKESRTLTYFPQGTTNHYYKSNTIPQKSMSVPETPHILARYA